MLFSSVTFIFVFLPIVCTTYLLIRPDLRNYVLLLASILFYAWGEPRYLIIMFASILINWAGAVLVDKYRAKAKLILVLSVLADLSFLYYFKYFNFTIENINALFHTNIYFVKVVMPIGISFYTFQAMSYLIDVYRKEVEVQHDIYKLALYITLFPQLVAGPIVKYHDVAEQINKRTITFDKVAYGVKRFIVGLGKKVLIANTLGAIADKIFDLPFAQLDCLTAWFGIVSYTLQIYYDFSGYSDMAIGLGSIFGFKFLENFDYPYISKTIGEYWRRWHISLGTWFKEYLYIPLGGNRVSKNRNLLNLWIVFLTTGFWHGAEWTFIIWGMWHGFFIVLERMTNLAKRGENWKFSTLKHIYTILVLVLGFVFFRSPSLTFAGHYFESMFGFGGVAEYGLSYFADRMDRIIFAISILCCFPIFKGMLQIKAECKVLRGFVCIWLIFIFWLSCASIAASTYNPFIYFRF